MSIWMTNGVAPLQFRYIFLSPCEGRGHASACPAKSNGALLPGALRGGIGTG